jgi:hypothetical protein
MKKFLVVALISLTVLASSAFSYSYTAFSLMSGDNTLCVNPFVFADGTGFVGTDLLVSYGMTEKSDIWLSYYQDNMGGNNFSLMARYDIKNSNILALKADPSAFSLQYHTIKENDKFGFQANAAIQLGYEYMDKPAIYAVLAPLIKLGSTGIDVFCEVNPGYYSQDGDFANLWERPEGFGLDVVPGIGVTVGDALISLSAPIYDVTNEPTPTFGAWVFFAIVSN